MEALRTAVEDVVGQRVEAMAVVRGGDVAASFRVELGDGSRLFAKTHPSAPPGFFSTEAASLAWLREAGAVPVPSVVAVSDGTDTSPAFLILEWIEEGRGTIDRARARRRISRAPRCRRTGLRARGPAHDRQPGIAERSATRLADVLRDVPAAPVGPAGEGRRRTARDRDRALERVAGSLGRFDTGEPPARLHGDLWAGNRLVDTTGRSWLIDPAAHGGHREFDLAMMRLFGGFTPECFDAYEARHPLSPGWQERIPLHQIAPLVVHAIKFGGGYVAAATAAIARY